MGLILFICEEPPGLAQRLRAQREGETGKAQRSKSVRILSTGRKVVKKFLGE
jgi:hypothetical protein